MKRIISFLLSVVMLFCIIAGIDFSAYALDSSGSCGENITYTFNSSSGLLIISGSGAMKDWNAYGSSRDGYNHNPFYLERSIKSVVIGSGITSIGDYSFYYCQGLTSVTIGSNATRIGYRAFYACTKLTNITFSKSLKIIDDSAFKGCTSLANITIPESVRIINDSAFIDTPFYNNGYWEGDVFYLSDVAFKSNNVNSSVKIKEGTRIIRSDAFSGCSLIKDVTIPDSVKCIGDYAFYSCKRLKALIIPDSVKCIGDNAFKNCSGLKELKMPCSAINNSFVGCVNIEKVILTKGSGTIPNFGTDSTEYATNICYLYTPWYISKNNCKEIILEDGIKNIGEYSFYNCTSLTNITIPDSVTSIGNYAFGGCNGLIRISIPNSVTKIGDYAFYNCTSLTSIIIPNCVTSIGKFTFYNCTNLTSVEIPESVTHVGNYAFYNCALSAVVYRSTQLNWESISIESNNSNLKNARILYSPDGVQGNCGTNIKYTYTNVNGIGVLTISGSGNMSNYGSANSSPFYNLAFDYLIIKDGVLNIGDYAFNNIPCLANVTIPNSVTSIGRYSLQNCIGLTNIIIPDSVKSIGNFAFSGCESLTNIVISDSETIIGNFAFNNCTNITSITIPESITNISGSAFSGCSNLKKINTNDIASWCSKSFGDKFPNAYSLYLNDELITHLTIPDGVTSISGYAFYNCDSITSATIPDSVTSIGSYAFQNCTGLTSITVGNNVTSIGEATFQNCVGLTSIIIPDSVKNIGNYALYNCTELKELTMPCSSKLYNSQYTFGGCTNIEKVTLTKGNGTMQSYGTSSASSATDTYYQYTPWYISRNNCKIIILEEGVKSIGSYSFDNCTGLTSVTIPNSVTSIGDAAFTGCSGLKKINTDDIASWCSKSFGNKFPNTYSLYLNDELITNLIIPDGVTDISDYAFYNCNSISSVKIPNSVTSIGDAAFTGCSSLRKINTDDIASWCSKSFGNKFPNSYSLCLNDEPITDLIIPDGVTGICDYAFYNCNSITSATIPDSVTSIGANAFNSCTGLIEIEIGTRLNNISADSFGSCSKIEKVSLLSNKLDSTQSIVGSMPNGSTLYALPSTDAQIYCNIYGVNFVALDEPKCDEGKHIYIETIVKDATCSETGIMHYKCHYCDNEYTEVIPLLDHTPVTDYAVNPTCTETGLTEGTHCSICGTAITAQQEIPATGHSYSSVVTEPTCKIQGYTTYTCSKCGDSYVDNYTSIDPDAHNYVKFVTEPTCTEKGYTTYTCELCGNSYTDNEVAATGHTYESVITKYATCIQAGVKTFTCSVCGDVYSEAIPVVDHTPITDNAVEPTCTDTGLTEGSHCSVCGKVFVAQEVINAKGHGFQNYTYDNNATCTENGTKTAKCSRCDTTDTVVVEDTVLGHDYSVPEVVKPATVSDEGTLRQICSRCDDFYDTVIPKTIPEGATVTTENGNANIEFDDGKTVTVPENSSSIEAFDNGTYLVNINEETNITVSDGVSVSVNKDGNVVVTETVGNTTTTVTVPSGSTVVKTDDGNYNVTIVTESGKVERTVNSGDSITIESDGKATCSGEHQFASGVLTVPATCTSAGEITSTCSVCGETKKESIDKLDHSVVIDKEVPATCTESGLTAGAHCTVCGTVITAQKTVAKKAHTYKTYTTKATTSKNGSVVTKCTVCGLVKSKSTIYYPKTITLSTTSYTYNGRAKKPTVKVVGSNGKTISSSNYTVSYASGRKYVGKYKVTVRFRGKYSGTKTLYFTIKPKSTSISSLKAGSKKFTVKWYKRTTQTTGYQVQYSTSSKFTSPKTVTISKTGTTSKTVKKLKAKKRYYVRVRTYKTVNGTRYYSSWSKAKYVKTKS